MIEFVSLLLGLVVGPTPLELAVDARAAAVEIRLDGERIALLERAPWTTTVDFGPVLEPRRLEAVAYGGDGAELGRASKLVNYAGSSYGVAIALDPQTPGERRTGRVVWRAVLDQGPQSLTLRFDGVSLAVSEAGRFTLPAHDPEALHFLETEIVFEDGMVGRAEVTFGGVYVESSQSSLTALPLISEPGASWSAEDARGWLRAGDRRLEVHSVRFGPGRAFVVRDPGFVADTRGLRGWLAEHPAFLPSASRHGDYEVSALDPRPLRRHAGTFRLVDLDPAAFEDGLATVLLARKPLAGSGPRELGRRPQLWDALAVGGWRAAYSNGRRAVVLMLGERPAERSRLTPAQASHYLASVRVPLFVWTPERLRPELAEAFELQPRKRLYVGPPMLRALVHAVERELASQTMAWIEGEHLPSEIGLARTAPPGISLAR